MKSMQAGVKALMLAWLVLTGSVYGHQIPSIQLEIDITSNGAHVLRLNIDPRLVISNTPASMPPVGVDWYREQTPEQVVETGSKTIAYIRKTLRFDYGSRASALDWEVQPMDGVSNQPLSDSTTEVHLLAVASHFPSATEASLAVSLAADAAAALTIITLIDGAASQRAQVLFPGESSKPVTWTAAAAPVTPLQPAIPFKWYLEPAKLVVHHVFQADLAGHVVFILMLGLCTKRPLLGLAVFHLLHLLGAFACSAQQTVLPQPLWFWPALCAALGLPLIRSRHAAALTGLVMTVLAIAHVLNEWPTATEPRITCLMEAVLSLSHLTLLLPVLLVRHFWAAKKAADQPPSPS